MNACDCNPSKYGRDKSKIIKDDDSVLSDRCWEEQYKGDSRKWLIRDASRQKIDSTLCSTMKATYQHPYQDDTKQEFVGVRRSLIEQKLYEEAVQEVTCENNTEPEIEEYRTEYDGMFQIPGFEVPDQFALDSELTEKYPLYKSSAASYWNFQLDKSNKAERSLPGFTGASNPLQPFKRNSGFSKPISEVLDNPDYL